jgi:hypothetical protein
VPTECEQRFDPRFGCDELQLFEPVALAARELTVRQIAVCPTAPESQRAVRQRQRQRWIRSPTRSSRLVQEPFEAHGVEELRRKVGGVCSLRGQYLHAGRQRLSESGDVDLDELPCRRGSRAVPERLDDLVHPARTALRDEDRQQPRMLGGERNRGAVRDDLQRAEHPELRSTH